MRRKLYIFLRLVKGKNLENEGVRKRYHQDDHVINPQSQGCSKHFCRWKLLDFQISPSEDEKKKKRISYVFRVKHCFQISPAECGRGLRHTNAVKNSIMPYIKYTLASKVSKVPSISVHKIVMDFKLVTNTGTVPVSLKPYQLISSRCKSSCDVKAM